MISEYEIVWLEAELGSGTIHAIVANKIIQALKNQKREVLQVTDQLTRCQSIIVAQKKTIAKQGKKLDRRRK